MKWRILAAAGAAAILLAACARTDRPERADDPPFFAPVGPDRIRATDGRVYFDNLNARIALLEERLEQRPSPALGRTLAQELFHRFQIVRAVRDLEEADRLVVNALQSGKDSGAILLKARIDAAFHRFGAALDRLDAIKVSEPSIEILRAEILRAIGSEAMSGGRAGLPDFRSLAAEAQVELDRGRLDAAMARFHLAERSYAGASPFPLAWLHLQIGIGYLRYGRFDAAQAFFESALDRLPAYTPALDHLAETLVARGREDRAIPIYLRLIEATGDPEFCGVLAEIERESGDDARSLDAEQCARTRFERLLSRHPQAYWQHAAEFYLSRGKVAEAYRLARLNLEHRQDVASRVLMARVALAHDQAEEGCRIVAAIRAAGWAPPELREIDEDRCASEP